MYTNSLPVNASEPYSLDIFQPSKNSLNFKKNVYLKQPSSIRHIQMCRKIAVRRVSGTEVAQGGVMQLIQILPHQTHKGQYKACLVT